MPRPPHTVLTDELLLARLIAFDSTSARSNRPIADFLCEYLERPGVEIVRNESADGEKVNVIAIAGPGCDASRHGLILCGHLDTVPANEPQWQSDPFTLTKRDGCYYGRGTADMKGFDALAINLMRDVDPASLRAPLALILTCDEELGSLGAKRLIETWPSDRALPRSAIIGEPTSLRAVRMHKGHLTMRITLRGKGAHTGSPHLGINAIEPAGEALRGLAALRKELEATLTSTSDFFPEVPFSVLAVSRIAGGSALNVIPETCIIELGVRLLPGEDSAEAIASVTAAANGVECNAHIEVAVVNNNPPMLTDENAPIHRALCDMLGQTESKGVSFASDGGHLSKMGIDCVLFGPGTIEVAHQPNESLPIEEFTRAKELLQSTVEEFTAEAQRTQRRV